MINQIFLVKKKFQITKTVFWHRKLAFGCASLRLKSVGTPVSLPLLESSSTVVVQCYATWTIGHKLRKFWWDFSGENACRTDNCWCHLNLQMGKGNNFKMAVVHSMYVFVERGTKWWLRKGNEWKCAYNRDTYIFLKGAIREFLVLGTTVFAQYKKCSKNRGKTSY